jgi:hypothetical protein
MPRLGFQMRRAGLRRTAAERLFALAQWPGAAIAADFDAAVGVVADAAGRVAQWADARTGLVLTQAVDAAKPQVSVHGWAPGLPAITGDGADDLLSGPSLALGHHWAVLIAERGVANGASTPTAREIFETGRSGDGLRLALLGERPGADAAQTRLKANAPGSAASFTAVATWAVGQRSVITVSIGPDGDALAIDGGVMGNRANSVGAVAATGTCLFGSAVGPNQRLGGKVARFLAIDYDTLPGKREQQYNRYLLEAHLAGIYALDKAGWPATHPFKARAPVASDWTGNNRLIQLLGNSIGNYTAPFYAPNLSYPYLAHGMTVTNACVGGNTTTQIRDRFLAGFDTGSTTTSGLPVADQRRKLTILGEFFQNGPTATSGDPEARMRGELAEIVAVVEAAQGAAPGQAHLMLWDSWVSWSDQSQSGTPLRAVIDARNAYLAATYPNYLFRASEIARATAAPGSPYADPTYHARQQPALARNRNADNTHPDDVLCNLICAGFMGLTGAAAWIEARGWDK